MSAAAQRQLAELLGLVPANPSPAEVEAEQAQEAGPPDFDGGVREPAPGPSDPEAEHGEFLIELLRNLPTSGGGGQW